MIRSALQLVGLLLALAAAACSPRRVELPATLAISPDFSAEEAEAIVFAADQWRKATAGTADLSPVIGSAGEIVIYPTSLPDITSGSTGVDSGGHASIGIDLEQVAAGRGRVPFTDALRDTAMHELGHAFGLEHAATGLMTASGYGGGCVDADSLARFCTEYGCPPGNHATCQVTQ